MTRPLLTLQDVTFAYPSHPWALRIPSLGLGPDRFTCIVGPNGSGKTTLLRVAAGLLRPQVGTVSWDGTPLHSLPRRTIARAIAYLPQETLPLFDYTVEEVVSMGRYPHSPGPPGTDERDRTAVEAALRAVGMERLRHRALSSLSGGERKRALIASVLAQEPSILLLDEPTAALDIHHAVGVMHLLSNLGTKASVVVVTHDINLATVFATRMVFVVDGQVRADGPVDAVLRPEFLEEVYGDVVAVYRHPDTGRPLVLPTLPRGAAATP